MNSTTKNARFWVYINDTDVKITLRPGQSLEHATGGPTEEGWSRSGNRWEWDGQVLTYSYVDDGCDCDGRLTRGGEVVCPAEDLKAGNLSWDDLQVIYPKWQNAEEWQRDYQAEAAGY